jgi:hypothetical protein
MTPMRPPAHTQPQPHVHFFSNGVLTNALPVHDDWATIEEDLARVEWEEVLKLFPDQEADLPSVFRWQ